MTRAIRIEAETWAGKCRSCGAPIRWARAIGSGRAIPFNPPLVCVPLIFGESRPNELSVDMDSTTNHIRTCPRSHRNAYQDPH